MASGVAVTTGSGTNHVGVGLSSSSGGAATLTGGSVLTSGAGALGLQATGSGSSIATSSGTTVSTTGANAVGAQADTGGAVTLGGGMVTTRGPAPTPSSSPVRDRKLVSAAPSTFVRPGLRRNWTLCCSRRRPYNDRLRDDHDHGWRLFRRWFRGLRRRCRRHWLASPTCGREHHDVWRRRDRASASDAASSGTAGSITVSGTLNIQTKNTAAAAVALQGNGASIFATGGGAIASAGNAIEFLGGKNQVATFDNFTIDNTTGNLIFADPSFSTVNFNNTTANAGTDNLDCDATHTVARSPNLTRERAPPRPARSMTDSASTSIRQSDRTGSRMDNRPGRLRRLSRTSPSPTAPSSSPHQAPALRSRR